MIKVVVAPAIEIAFVPNLLTKNRFEQTNKDSIKSSATMGTDNKIMVLLMLPDVKLLSVPASERLKRLNKERVFKMASFISFLLRLILLHESTDAKDFE